jgi:hypothetical protein
VLDQAPGFSVGAAISGMAREGQTLTASATGTESDWIITYQWQQNGSNISGATGATYVVQEGDEGHTIDVVATVANANNATTTSTSLATAAVTDIILAFTSGASISGTAKEGTPLTAVNGILNDSDGAATGYQWQISANGSSGSWSNITGANNQSYTPGESDEGQYLRMIETATDSDGGPSVTSTSAPTGPVQGVADTPVIQPVPTQTVNENSSRVQLTGLTLLPGDGSTSDSLDTYNVTLSVTNGQLSGQFGGLGLTVSISTDGKTLNLSGPLAGIQTALQNDVQYTPNAGVFGTNSDTLIFSATSTEEQTVGGAISAAVTTNVQINVTPVPPTGLNFTEDTGNLAALEGAGSVLTSATALGTFTETGGIPGDVYSFTLGGPNAGTYALTTSTLPTVPTTYIGTLATDGSNVSGTLWQLTVQANDTTNQTSSAARPFDVVVDGSASDTLTLTGTGSLGIAAGTPTIVYGLNGNDNLSASGMTANVWFVGGAGADTMTGSSGVNRYLYAGPAESPGGSNGGNADIITNFHASIDIIDTTAISGINTIQGLISGNTKVNAHSIAWIANGSETDVLFNSGTGQESNGSTDMEMRLSNFAVSNLNGNSDANHRDFSYTGHLLPGGTV